MVLGSNGLTVLEMASGYGTFMNAGMKMDRHGISQITNSAGDIIFDYRRDKPSEERVLKESTASVMNNIMAQIPERGTGRRAALNGIRSAGKTGTTQAYRDAWYVGYTGNYVSAIWYGNDNYQPTKRLTGGRLPAMTWQKFMNYAHQNIELRPIPFIENPLPGPSDDAPVFASETGDIDTPPPTRPKLLSRNAENMLRNLETIFKSAKPLKPNDELAGAASDRVVTQ